MTFKSMFDKSLVLAILLLPCPQLLVAQASADSQNTEEKRFQAQTNLFLFQRSLEFETEIVLHEAFLLWLYEGITEETNKRRKEDLRGARSAMELLDPAALNDSSYMLPQNLYQAPPRVKYQTWEKLQRDMYVNKYTQARRIKDRLLINATPAQIQRMFEHDLATAIESYNSGYYHQAVLRFNEVLERYGYENVADIIFYRAESFLKISMPDQAQSDYQYAVKESDDPEIRRRSLERLIALAGDEGDLRELNNYWLKYKDESSGLEDDTYWITVELAARYFMALRGWADARELFDLIPPDQPMYIAARLLAADCALGMLDLLDAEVRYADIAEERVKGKGLTRDVMREALLKLGYIDYLTGNYYDAYDKLSSMKGKGELVEKANVMAAWSLYRVHDYGAVIELCNKFIEEFPQSQYFYEIFCLLGYSQEVIGHGEEAKTEYEKVMTAVDERREFSGILLEKKYVSEALGELQRLEPQLFLEGKQELFVRYNDLRLRLRSIFERLKLTEGILSSPIIQDMLVEQKELYRLFEELTTVEKELFATENAGLIAHYDALYTQLIDLATDLKSGVRFEMNRKSLVHREQELQVQARFQDSLRVQFEQEWQSSKKALEDVRRLRLEAESSGDKALLTELGELELSLMHMQNRLMGVSQRLNSLAAAEINSNLDHWSWFAYQRHATSGLAFDYLYMRENRIQELDQYISRINEIIAERTAEEKKEEPLSESLVPASAPGEGPYYAPPVPMWTPEVQVAPVADTTAVDSSAAGETLPGETAPAAEPPVKGAQPSGQTGAEEGVIPTQHVEPTEGTPPEQTPESGNETAPEKDQQGSETKPQGQGAVDNPPQVDKPANDGENAIDDDY